MLIFVMKPDGLLQHGIRVLLHENATLGLKIWGGTDP